MKLTIHCIFMSQIIPGANGNANLDTITCTARPILCERLGTLDRSFQVRFQSKYKHHSSVGTS